MGFEVSGIFGLIILVADIWAIVSTFQSQAGTGKKSFLDCSCFNIAGDWFCRMVDSRPKIREIRLKAVLKPLFGFEPIEIKID